MHHLGEDTFVSPPPLMGLRRSLFPWRSMPAQAVVIDENNTAQGTPVINAWLGMALWKEGPQPLDLDACQPENILYHHLYQCRNFNRAGKQASCINGAGTSSRHQMKKTSFNLGYGC